MNNFENLKKDFQKETGQQWNVDIKTYIAYYQAKMIDVLLGELAVRVQARK